MSSTAAAAGITADGTAAAIAAGGMTNAAGTAPGPSARSVPSLPPAGTGARTEEAAALVGGARERIDDIDRGIVALVRERMAVSAGIQQARLASGGRRVHLAREMEVINAYSGALGRPGTALAMTLLELCRGRV